jgi:iron complex transport system substrate-binding protein
MPQMPQMPQMPVPSAQCLVPEFMRVVSLLASGTEIVCALGAGEMLVGRSHECDNPDWVRRLPVCTNPAFDINRSSKEIDAEVRRRIRAGEALYHVDADRIASLKPDLLITQVHCDVCAVTPGDIARAGCAVTAPVVSLSANTVTEIYDGIRAVAAAANRHQAGEDLVSTLQGRIDAVSLTVRGRAKPTVAVLEWTAPVFAAGNWCPELIEAAGAVPVPNARGHHSPAVPWQQILDADPDYLVVAPCGFDLERTLQERAVLEDLPGWLELRAVREGRAAFADGNRYFNRSGITIVETVEILAEIVHGVQFDRPWRGTAWSEYAERSTRVPHVPDDPAASRLGPAS